MLVLCRIERRLFLLCNLWCLYYINIYLKDVWFFGEVYLRKCFFIVL